MTTGLDVTSAGSRVCAHLEDRDITVVDTHQVGAAPER